MLTLGEDHLEQREPEAEEVALVEVLDHRFDERGRYLVVDFRRAVVPLLSELRAEEVVGVEEDAVEHLELFAHEDDGLR